MCELADWGNSGESNFKILWRPEIETGPEGLNHCV